MQCPRCRHENRPQAKFCEECASPLTRSCAKCGNPLPPTAKFCPECANPVGADGATPSRFPSPETYTPKHLAEKIVTSRTSLEGERKQVTVLFADMKGSTELLADRDPEDARTLLDPVLTLLMEAVHRYEGTVNQVLGDGIMALFGAPLAHEDHAVRACYAALRMQEAVRRYSDELRRSHGVEVQIRVGLNSGEVVVRSIASDLHMDYTAVGQTTHLAARMEQLATPGSTRISADTLALAEGYVRVWPLGAVPIKGLGEPIEVYDLVGASGARTRLQAAARQGLSRFVGRDTELEHLRNALGKAGQGHGQLVAVVGDPGVGKSRLFYEFTHSHRVQDWLVIAVGSASYGTAIPYLPVIDLLKAYFRVQERDEQRRIREKVTGKLLTLDEGFRSLLPALLALLDVPVDEGEWQALDPAERRRHTLDAIRRLLLRESQVQPLCLIFEDLQWIDSETQAVLDGLVESLPTARILLLVNYRPEYRQGWSTKTYYSQARIDPLPAEGAASLLDALLGEDPSLGSLKHLLIERTEGNPLFLEESVQALVEGRALAGDPGQYELARSVASIQVPATVQAILAARIDRLPPEEKRTLQSAAVVGKDVPFALLREIAELPEDALREQLGHLQTAEFLYETGAFGDLEYTFKHALTHDVAYGSLLAERRRTLHARIVDAIGAVYGDRVTEHLPRLADHAFRGELWVEAVGFLRQAASRAAGRSAWREAAAALERALAALAHLPETRDTIAQAVDLRCEFQPALTPLGEGPRMLEHLQEAEPLAERLGDARRLGRVAAHLAQCFWIVGENERGLASGERALVIARSLGDVPLEVLTRLRLGQIYLLLGRPGQALDVLTLGIECLADDFARDGFEMSALPAVACRSVAAHCLSDLGRFGAARAMADEAVRIAEASGHAYSIAWACQAAALARVGQGAGAEAARWAERSLDIARRDGLGNFISLATTALGRAYALLGRASEGAKLLEQMTVQHHAGARLSHAVGLSEAYLLGGRPDEALSRAQGALAVSRGQKARAFEAAALRLSGEARAAEAPLDGQAAESELDQALAIAVELGMRPLTAQCHLGLGRLHRRAGATSRARDHLATAIAMLREMEMRFWMERAEAEISGIP